MGKTIKNIRLASIILILFEVVALALFSVFYFNNLFDIQTLIPITAVILGAVVIVGLNALFVWVVVVRISHLRQKTDLHAAEVIGSDVQEAYNFAMVGLAVTDDNDVVLWTNDLFKDRHLDIIDTNILKWIPQLEELKKNNGSTEALKVIVNSRNYDVKYLPDAGLWIFKDSTDYEEVVNYNKQQAPVVGVLTIDNYGDATHGETEDLNDVITKIKSAIFAYAKQYNVLLRKFREDSYYLLCNFESLDKMRNDKFSLVDIVRQIGFDEGVPITLSIGIAHDFPDVVKLNEMASDALDIAMSRGGDQVAISEYGRDMEFFGGKTEAQEKRSRVRVRVLADSLISLVRASSNVLIMGHANMDMDALGACLGIQAICRRVDKKSMIIIDLKSTEVKTRGALLSSFSRDELDTMRCSPKEAMDLLTSDTLLVIVDVHTRSMCMAPALVDKASKVVVIDHHRRAEDYIESPVLNHIDPSSSSASELVTEFIKFCSINPKVEVPASYATIMLSGIYLDTHRFRSRQTGIRTFEACTVLKEYGADNSLADDFLKDEEEEYFIISGIVKNMKYHSPGVVYVVADPSTEYDSATLSKVADTCMSMRGVKASFVIGRAEHMTKMSCRSDGSISVQIIAEKMGGGGHLSMAAAAYKNKSVYDVVNELQNVLDTNLNVARNDAVTRKVIDEGVDQ